MKQVARAYPDQQLHLVMDNYATHKRVEVRDWLAANPRIHVHFTRYLAGDPVGRGYGRRARHDSVPLSFA